MELSSAGSHVVDNTANIYFLFLFLMFSFLSTVNAVLCTVQLRFLIVIMMLYQSITTLAQSGQSIPAMAGLPCHTVSVP